MSGWLDWLEKIDPLFKASKKGAYAIAKQDSDNMEGIGRAIGWDWLTQEAQRNQKNPGRAIGKAAATAASIYAGGLLGGGAGGAGSAAGNAAGTFGSAGTAGVGPVMSGTAYEAAIEAAKQAAANGAVQSGNAAANGLLGFQGELSTIGNSGLLGGSAPQNVGIAHNTALDAIRYGNGDVMGNLGRWATSSPKGPAGMSAGDAKLGLMGMQMMQGEPEQRQPAPPPPPAAPPVQSSFTGYGDQPPPGIDPMTWAQLPDHLKKQLMMGRAA